MDLAASLVQLGILAPDAVTRALAAARNGDVASAALKLGLCEEAALARALAQARECPAVDLSRSVIPVTNLDVMAPDFCLERKVLPVTVGRSEIVLAMSDPDDLPLADEVRFVTGRKVLRYAAVAHSIERALHGVIRAREQGRVTWAGPGSPAMVDPGAGWAAVVKPGERTLPSVDLPEADEKMELISTSDDVGPFAPAVPSGSGGYALPGARGTTGSRPLTGVFVPAPAQQQPPAPDQARPAVGGTEGEATLRLSGVATGKVALAVDDDPDVLRLLTAMLGKLGCVVLQAQNGRQALDMVRDARPDVVLLDAMMPGMHGFEVCRTIKADRQLRRTPVILCSAIYRGTVGSDAQIAFGADAFLEKPFRVEELMRVVRVALVGPVETAEEKVARADAERSWRAAAQALTAGRDGDASQLARAACARDPRSAEAHYYLGHALTRQGQLYEAVAAYERSAELRPDIDAAHQCLAQSYERLGFHKSAREAWARAIETCKDPARKKAMQARLVTLLGV